MHGCLLLMCHLAHLELICGIKLLSFVINGHLSGVQ